MEDRETARMRKYGESKTTRIMMATVPHVISGLGIRKFQADGFLLTRVYIRHWYMSRRFDDTFQARPGWSCLKMSSNLRDTYQCRMYSEKLLMMGRGTARNMWSFLTKSIWEISASVGFIKKKFVTMLGHMNVKLVWTCLRKSGNSRSPTGS